MVFFLCFGRIFAHPFLLLLNFFVFALVVVCEVGKGFDDDVRTAGRIGVSIRVDRLDGEHIGYQYILFDGRFQSLAYDS